VAGFDELTGVIDIGGEEEIEGGVVRDLREEGAGRAVGRRDDEVGVLLVELDEDFVEGELEIGSGGDGDGCSSQSGALFSSDGTASRLCR